MIMLLVFDAWMLGLFLQVFGAIETDEEIGFPQSSSQSVNVSQGSGGLLVHVILYYSDINFYSKHTKIDLHYAPILV